MDGWVDCNSDYKIECEDIRQQKVSRRWGHEKRKNKCCKLKSLFLCAFIYDDEAAKPAQLCRVRYK
jgi:hypothetical protein